jgi:hypothetical protein
MYRTGAIQISCWNLINCLWLPFTSAKGFFKGDYTMSNNSNGSVGETLSPILVILVAGSICLAIVNKDNHPAYFDIVKIAMAYSFGSIKSQGKTKHSDNQDNVDDDEDGSKK